jgi:hypothetical protein
MVGKAQKLHGARRKLNSVFRLEKVDHWNPIRTFAIQFRIAPCDFWAFPTMRRELQGKKFRSASVVCSKFLESCNICIAFQGRYFKKETVTTPPQSSDLE